MEELKNLQQSLYGGNNMVYELKGKTALVTGSTSGIGKSISIFLANEGMKVIGIGRREEKHKELKGLLGDRYEYVIADLFREGEIGRIIKEINGMTDGVEILVNNAGMYKYKPFEQWSVDEIRNMLKLNLQVPIELYKGLEEAGMEKRLEQVLWVCSVSGLSNYENEAVYEVTKHGIRAFALSRAKELKKSYVGEQNRRERHVVIYPDYLTTEIVDNIRAGEKQPWLKELEGAYSIPTEVIMPPLINILKGKNKAGQYNHIKFSVEEIDGKLGVYMFPIPLDSDGRLEYEKKEAVFLSHQAVPLLQK